jgi:hypothetical protein
MDIEYFVLSEIEKGARHIKPPTDISGKFIIIKLILKGLIKNKTTHVTILQNGAILNHYRLTQEGMDWLAEHGEHRQAI